MPGHRRQVVNACIVVGLTIRRAAHLSFKRDQRLSPLTAPPCCRRAAVASAPAMLSPRLRKQGDLRTRLGQKGAAITHRVAADRRAWVGCALLQLILIWAFAYGGHSWSGRSSSPAARLRGCSLLSDRAAVPVLWRSSTGALCLRPAAIRHWALVSLMALNRWHRGLSRVYRFLVCLGPNFSTSIHPTNWPTACFSTFCRDRGAFPVARICVGCRCYLPASNMRRPAAAASAVRSAPKRHGDSLPPLAAVLTAYRCQGKFACRAEPGAFFPLSAISTGAMRTRRRPATPKLWPAPGRPSGWRAAPTRAGASPTANFPSSGSRPARPRRRPGTAGTSSSSSSNRCAASTPAICVPTVRHRRHRSSTASRRGRTRRSGPGR